MTATQNKVRQSELMARLKMLPGEIVKFRDANLSRDLHWWKEGTTIYWTEEAAKWLEGKEESPQETTPQEGEFASMFIAKACPNPRFVIGDMNGNKVKVRCHPKFSKNIIRKTVKVRVIQEGDETIYQYER